MKRPSGKVTIHAALVCDEIRKEATGKYFLIGVYTGDILAQKFPLQLKLGSCLFGKRSGEGEVETEVRFVVRTQKKKPSTITGKISIRFDKSSEDDVCLPLPPITLKFESPGTLTVQTRHAGGSWKKVLAKRVSQLTTSA